MLNITEMAICSSTTTHTVIEYPSCLAKTLIIGNMANSGRADANPNTKTFFDPHRSWIRAKKNAWISPFKTPKMDNSFPIVDGGKPRPPR